MFYDSRITQRNVQEWNKRYCETYKQKKDIGHLCYIQQKKKELPPSDEVLCVLYDFQTTENTRYTHTATVHIPNLVCVQQLCLRCYSVEYFQQDCAAMWQVETLFLVVSVWGQVIASLRTATVGQTDRRN